MSKTEVIVFLHEYGYHDAANFLEANWDGVGAGRPMPWWGGK